MSARRVLAAGVLLITGTVLTGCGSVSTPAPGPSSTAATSSRPGSTSPPRPPMTTAPSRPPTTPGPAAFPANLSGQDVERIPTSRRIVALTFDAGANADGLPAILGALVEARAPATFFLTKDFVTTYPGSARQIAAAGFRLGDHSVDHPHFPSLTDAQMRAEVLDAARSIRTVTGSDPAPFFRFPYGDRTPHAIAVVNGIGYVPIRWTVDSLGWQGTMSGSRGALFVSERVLTAAEPGMIVLMHLGSNPDDHSTLDAAALPEIIAGLRSRGYALVTLDALLS